AGHGMHHRATPGQPAWLAALEMCGYCELLTLNPPLSLPPQLLLPEHQPTFVLPLPETPQPAAPRRGDGHPRAPPVSHGCSDTRAAVAACPNDFVSEPLMTRNPHCAAVACARAAFTPNSASLRWKLAHAALLAGLSGGALAMDHAHHELTPTVITGVAPAASVTVATDPKIPRQPVPASDAGDYLQTIPGFSAVRGGGSNADPVFRGMFGSRLNLLSNGGVMLGACPSRMDSPSSYITPQNFDSLTVIKGPQTVLWGPGAS